MASSREIERIRSDSELSRAIAEALLSAEPDALDDWQEPFVRSLLDTGQIDRLSERQCEKLLEARDGAALVVSYEGVSVEELIRLCHAARFDLREAHEEWLVERHAESQTQIRRRYFKQLMRCARQLRLH